MLPDHNSSLWALVGMAAIMGGTMRSPFTGIVFALELTWDVKVLPALLIASFVSYGFTVLFMKRSILTEKVARRGYHISREYSVDPLERLGVGEVMTTNVVTIPAAMPVVELLKRYFQTGGLHRHQAYPVVDEKGLLLGVITRTNLLEDWVGRGLNADLTFGRGDDECHHCLRSDPADADHGLRLGIVPDGGGKDGRGQRGPAAGRRR